MCGRKVIQVREFIQDCKSYIHRITTDSGLPIPVDFCYDAVPDMTSYDGPSVMPFVKIPGARVEERPTSTKTSGRAAERKESDDLRDYKGTLFRGHEDH